jgi:hypothetical protein
MISFSEYLLEAAGDPISSNIGNIKTRGHIKRYIFPYLSSKQKKASSKNLSQIFNDKDQKESDLDNHGDSYDQGAEYTHELASNFGPHKKGTRVKVTGLNINGNNVVAQTEKHGVVPISKLGKPENLAAKNKTSEGFKLEHILQKNVDSRFKPAGSTGNSWDFVAGDPNSPHSIKGKAVKKDESKPIFRGESKGSKTGNVAMGTISAGFNNETGKWEYSKKTKSKMASKFNEAVHPDSGLSIIDHMNKYHKDGNLNSGFSIKAPAGTSRHYLNGLGANSLHLHRYALDSKGNYTMNHGTTYTVGNNNEFQGKVGLSHLNDEDLDKLDGQLTVEPSGVGKIQIKHRPKPSVFNEYANKSKDDPNNHMDLSREEHGNKFREMFVNHINSLKDKKVVEPTQQQVTALKHQQANPILGNNSGEHGGTSFYSPSDIQHAQDMQNTGAQNV